MVCSRITLANPHFWQESALMTIGRRDFSNSPPWAVLPPGPSARTRKARAQSGKSPSKVIILGFDGASPVLRREVDGRRPIAEPRQTPLNRRILAHHDGQPSADPGLVGGVCDRHEPRQDEALRLPPPRPQDLQPEPGARERQHGSRSAPARTTPLSRPRALSWRAASRDLP